MVIVVGHSTRPLGVMKTRQPSFSTPRLSLHPARLDDLPALHELWSDAQVKRFLFDDQPVSLELAESALSDCLAHSVEGLGLWLVHETNGPSMLGCVGLNRATVAAEYESMLTGLFEPLASFSPRYWHKGFAREAVRPLLDYAFGPLDQSRLAAVNDVPNIASEKMLLCLGFKPYSEVLGPRHPLRTYQLSREDWLQQ